MPTSGLARIDSAVADAALVTRTPARRPNASTRRCSSATASSCSTLDGGLEDPSSGVEGTFGPFVLGTDTLGGGCSTPQGRETQSAAQIHPALAKRWLLAALPEGHPLLP